MKQFCVTTLVTNNEWQSYIPLFTYTFRRANPGIDIQICIMGKPDNEIIKKYGDVVKEISDYTLLNATPNTLRFLTNIQSHNNYEYVYYTDIDFLFFRHNPQLMNYMHAILWRGGECYAGMRGPIHPKNPKHLIKEWSGENTRIAGGAFMVSKEWYRKTEKARCDELSKLRGNPDTLKLREQDEIILYRICKNSGLKTPEQKGCFVSGEPYDIKYRDIHLGDFKFDHRWKNTAKMKKKWLTDENCRLFIALEREPMWKEVCKLCCGKSPMVNQVIFNLRQHIKNRGIE